METDSICIKRYQPGYPCGTRDLDGGCGWVALASVGIGENDGKGITAMVR
jgi:hypothetical protein